MQSIFSKNKKLNLNLSILSMIIVILLMIRKYFIII